MGSLFDISGRSAVDRLERSRERLHARGVWLSEEEAFAADEAALRADWDAVAKDLGDSFPESR